MYTVRFGGINVNAFEAYAVASYDLQVRGLFDHLAGHLYAANHHTVQLLRMVEVVHDLCMRFQMLYSSGMDIFTEIYFHVTVLP